MQWRLQGGIPQGWGDEVGMPQQAQIAVGMGTEELHVARQIERRAAMGDKQAQYLLVGQSTGFEVGSISCLMLANRRFTSATSVL